MKPELDVTRVVVIFDDQTLGGVSRSALNAGRIWRTVAAEVTFLALSGVDNRRIAQFLEVGEVVSTAEDLVWRRGDLAHWHHGAVTPALRAQARRIIASASRQAPIPLMTKNVFSVNDRIFDDWPGPVISTVLGTWAIYQYRFQRGDFSLKHIPFVVPNVLDDSFFRPPSPAERASARERFEVPTNAHLVVRIGSPLQGKWSDSYVRLVEESHESTRFVFIGAPEDLAAQLSHTNVSHFATTSDDLELRDAYWAADCFALDAERGESFGNVAFEALLSGTPVVYRARPFRDNTPWELSSLSGFSYAKSTKVFIEACQKKATVSESDRRYLSERYILPSVAKTYRAIFEKATGEAEHAKRIWLVGKPTPPLSLRERLQVLTRHNPLAARAKELRLAVLSGGRA